MKTLTPKGKKALLGIGIAIAIIVVWLFFPRIRTHIGNTPPIEFEEEAHTEFIDFVSSLPRETDHYTISFDYYYNQVVIKPLVTIDESKDVTAELERLWPTYEAYAQEALTWMKDQKADPASFDLFFFGQDFWPPGRTITP